MHSSSLTFVSLLVGSLVTLSSVGCASPPSDDVATQSAAYSNDPLSGDELAFEPFMHDDLSANGWPAHDFVGFSKYVMTADGKRVSLSAHLYLERDRSFTLFYSETVMVSQFAGNPRTMRKLAGEWKANGTTLELAGASAKLGRARDGWNREVDGLVVTLPAGWQSADVADVVLDFYPTSSNAGPSAVFFEDYR
jgi:hypothetical protein